MGVNFSIGDSDRTSSLKSKKLLPSFDDLNVNNPSSNRVYPNKKLKITYSRFKISCDNSGLNYPSRVDGNKMNPKKKNHLRVKLAVPLYPGRG